MSIFDLVKDSVGAVKNMGQELVVDLPKYIAGKVHGNDVAAENARQNVVKHGKQGLKDLNNVLKNSVIDEFVSKVPYGEKLRGPVTQGLDKLDEIFEEEMKRQGIIPGDKPAANVLDTPDIVMERAAPKLPGVPKAAGKAEHAFEHATGKSADKLHRKKGVPELHRKKDALKMRHG